MSMLQPQDARTISLSLIVLLALLTAMDAMAIDMYLPGMPDIAAEFGATPGRIQQTLSVFLAGMAIGQGLYGPLLDRFGRRLPLLVGTGIFVAGSVLGALASSVEWLLTARFVQALGAAAGVATPRAIVADLCTLAESARIFSLLMQVMGIAPILAPIIGGFLLGHGGWRLVFWALAGLGVGGVIWGLREIPDSQPAARRVPLRFSNVIRAYERQLRNPVFMAYALSGSFTLSSLFIYISGSAFIFTGHFGLTPAQFSYVFAANSICLVLGGMLSSLLLRSGCPIRRILVGGLVAHALAALALFLMVRLNVATLALYVTLLALAIGALGLVHGNVTALTMNRAGPQAGTASALMGMMQYLISAIVGAIVSLTVPGLGQLPLAVGVCGVLALLLYHVAGRVACERGVHDTRPAEG